MEEHLTDSQGNVIQLDDVKRRQGSQYTQTIVSGLKDGENYKFVVKVVPLNTKEKTVRRIEKVFTFVHGMYIIILNITEGVK